MSFNLVCTVKILTKMTLYQHNRNITTKEKNGSFPYAFMSMLHFCPAVKQRACTDLQRVWVSKMDLSLNSFTILIIISIVLSVSFMLLR